MLRRPPGSTLTATLFPPTTLFLSVRTASRLALHPGRRAAAVAGIEGAAARLLLPARGRGARAAVRQAAARALLDGGLPGRDGTADHRRPGLVRGRTHLAVAGHRLRRDRGGDAAGRGALVLVERRRHGGRAADLPGRGRDRRPELPLVLD